MNTNESYESWSYFLIEYWLIYKSILLSYAEYHNESKLFKNLDNWLSTFVATGEQDVLEKERPILLDLNDFSTAVETLIKIIMGENLSDYHEVRIKNQRETINRKKEEIVRLQKEFVIIQNQIEYLTQSIARRKELLIQISISNDNHTQECKREINFLFDLKKTLYFKS